MGLSFLIPRTQADLARRRRMSKTWADATCGMMGRSAAREKVALFKLAWDLVGSDFGARHTLYELYYVGDPSALMASFHREFDKAACIARVKAFLAQPADLVR